MKKPQYKELIAAIESKFHEHLDDDDLSLSDMLDLLKLLRGGRSPVDLILQTTYNQIQFLDDYDASDHDRMAISTFLHKFVFVTAADSACRMQSLKDAMAIRQVRDT